MMYQNREPFLKKTTVFVVESATSISARLRSLAGSLTVDIDLPPVVVMYPGGVEPGHTLEIEPPEDWLYCGYKVGCFDASGSRVDFFILAMERFHPVEQSVVAERQETQPAAAVAFAGAR